jgi:hypothetical protein
LFVQSYGPWWLTRLSIRIESSNPFRAGIPGQPYSSNNTLRSGLRRASSNAAMIPAGPAPITQTSVVSSLLTLLFKVVSGFDEGAG